MNYTKGEWKAVDSSAGGLVMAGLFPYVVGCAEGTIARVTIEANAHLIAAAPLMYEALKETDMIYAEYCALNPEPLTGSWNLVQGIIAKVHTALAKAEGK